MPVSFRNPSSTNERNALRQWIDNNQNVIGIVAGVIIIGVVAWMFIGGSEPEFTPEDEAWYFDVVEKRAFRDASRQIPPIESPWGNDGVRVFYFSCGECSEDERFAGFYMKFNDEWKAKMEADEKLKGQAFGESHPGRMYSSDAINWVAAPHVGASGVTAALAEKCKGRLRTCR